MLGVRLDPEIDRGLSALAKRQRRTKSDIVREVVARHVRLHDEAYLAEARRQSLRAAEHDSEEEQAFWESVSAWDADNA